MTILFYIAAVVAVFSTCMVLTRMHPVHALLYLVVSLLSVAMVFFSLGAPFMAALEVMVYAGAIMVLFIFVVMMLNLGEETVKKERSWLAPKDWIGPGILAAVLFGELMYAFWQGNLPSLGGEEISPKQVGIALYGPYLVALELAGLLLLAGLVGAFHLGRREKGRS